MNAAKDHQQPRHDAEDHHHRHFGPVRDVVQKNNADDHQMHDHQQCAADDQGQRRSIGFGLNGEFIKLAREAVGRAGLSGQVRMLIQRRETFLLRTMGAIRRHGFHH